MTSWSRRNQNSPSEESEHASEGSQEMDEDQIEHEAGQQWHLARLYHDLGKAKHEVHPLLRPELTNVERTYLCRLLLGHSPKEIAASRVISEGTVKTALSTGIYRYVEKLTGRPRLSLGNWRNVKGWLEEAGYRLPLESLFPPRPEQLSGIKLLRRMPEVTHFYGREQDLDSLKNSVLGPTRRMVSIIGHAGMGKTSLAVKLVQAFCDESVANNPFPGGYIWQSLRDAPPLDNILASWLAGMSGVEPRSNDWHTHLNVVMDYFQAHRCLIVLDNLESILDAEALGGYKEEHLPYREFLQRLGEEPHQSCLIVTSRWHTPEINGFPDSPMHAFLLQGLNLGAAEQLLSDQKLPIDPKGYWKELIRLYRGNPLMLKMAAQCINKLFDKDTGQFLQCSNTVLSRDLRTWVGRLCLQLSQDESDVLKEITAYVEEYNEPMPIEEIQHPNALDAVDTLLGRGLIEKSSDGVRPIPVVEDYFRNWDAD